MSDSLLEVTTARRWMNFAFYEPPGAGLMAWHGVHHGGPAALSAANERWLCRDSSARASIRQGIQEILLANFGVSDCVGLKKHCNEFGGKGALLRLHCPETCGCHSSGQLLAGARFGCPVSCISTASRDTNNNCEDKAADDPLWKLAVLNLRNVAGNITTINNLELDKQAGRLQSKGCTGLSEGAFDSVFALGNFTLCHQELLTRHGLRPFSILCPRTCGCGKPQNRSLTSDSLCPAACGTSG